MQQSKLAISMTIVAIASMPFAVRAADVESLPDAAVSEQQTGQQCQSDLRTFEVELARTGFGVLAPGTSGSGYAGYGLGYGLVGTPRQRMQVLRDAAAVYALEGDEKACRMVLASMQRIRDEHNELIGLEAEDPEARTAWRRAHLARALPVTDMDRLMRADVVIGADLRTPDDVKLGEVEDVVLDPKQQTISYVLISRGGFLGLGEDLVAVRWSDLRATDDHEIYVLDASTDAFAAAPEVGQRNFEEISDDAWRSSLDRYWTGVMDKP